MRATMALNGLNVSLDNLLEEPEDIKNARSIPGTIQVHKAIRRMDIICYAIDFFRFKFGFRPLTKPMVR